MNECSTEKNKDQMYGAHHEVDAPQHGTHGPTLGVSLSGLQKP